MFTECKCYTNRILCTVFFLCTTSQLTSIGVAFARLVSHEKTSKSKFMSLKRSREEEALSVKVIVSGSGATCEVWIGNITVRQCFSTLDDEICTVLFPQKIGSFPKPQFFGFRSINSMACSILMTSLGTYLIPLSSTLDCFALH
jgi:hypothetical protein